MKQNEISFFSDFSELQNALKNLITQYSKCFVLVDSNTLKHCWSKLANEELQSIEILEVEPGEESKSLEICYQLWSALRDAHADRKSLLINLGGGVITDLGGFVSSTFKRGIDTVHIPTSLLGMVDAAVGGKTGINLDHSKNQIGTFNLNIPVFVCSDFLETLDQRHLKSGYAEVIKHGLISNRKYWDVVKCYDLVDTSKLERVVKESIQIKSDIVEKDPLEKGIRKSLNFGHTVGHALESLSMDSENPLFHGEAVGLGMYVESKIALSNNKLSATDFEEIHAVLSNFFDLSRLNEYDIDPLWKEIQNDKKIENGVVYFIELHGIGNPNLTSKLDFSSFETAYKSLVK